MDKGKFGTGNALLRYGVHLHSEALGTGNGLLWYGICARCKKQAPVVRDAFSEALGAQNRLLWYGRDIRYRKRPPTVRGASSERITKKRDAEKLHPHNQFTQAIKP